MGIIVIQNISHINTIKKYLVLTNNETCYALDGDIVLLLPIFLHEKDISEMDACMKSKEIIQDYLKDAKK
jgi:hypothetical protein